MRSSLNPRGKRPIVLISIQTPFIKPHCLCPPVCSPHVTLYCVHLKVSTFMAAEQSGVSFGAEAAACSRGPALGSPYPTQLGFVIGSPRLKDTVHHLTHLNACKMSNQHRVWSLWPAAPGLLPAGPRRPLWSFQEQISVFPFHEVAVPGFICTGGNMHGHGCPPYIKLIKYSIWVETLLTLITPDTEPARYGSWYLWILCGLWSFSTFSWERYANRVFVFLPWNTENFYALS